MTTKEYLNQVSRYNRMINNKLVEIQQMREMACSISAVCNEERVQSSGSHDKMVENIAKIDELERKLDKTIDRYVDTKNKIIEQIDNIDNEMSYIILFSRYIEKKTFEEISVETQYSWRQIIRLHGKALQEFETKYGKEYL